MQYKAQLTLEQSKALLLSNCPVNEGVIGSHDLLTKSGLDKFGTDNLRYAYWTLVGNGQLVRVANGVYKKC